MEIPALNFVGKLGDKVYYYRDGELVVRPYYVPVQPATPLQVSNWEKFKAGIAAWHLLTSEEKEYYNSIARPLRLSGWNKFLSVFMLS